MGPRQRHKAKAMAAAAAAEATTAESGSSVRGAKQGSKDRREISNSTPPGPLYSRAYAAMVGRHDLNPEDVLEVLHWSRQLLGLFFGILFGILRLTGVTAITTFFVLCVIVPNSYVHRALRVEEEQVAKVGSPKTEGVMSAVAIFFLFWILTYTTFLDA